MTTWLVLKDPRTSEEFELDLDMIYEDDPFIEPGPLGRIIAQGRGKFADEIMVEEVDGSVNRYKRVDDDQTS